MVEGTLLDNIVMGYNSEHPDMDRIDRVLRLASLNHFVGSLPKGVYTPVGEGGSLLSLSNARTRSELVPL